MAIDRDREDRVADAAGVVRYCRCGDAESDHLDGVFVNLRPDETPVRACVVLFCRCSAFTPMTVWNPFGSFKE